MKLIRFKTKRNDVYINPESITYIQQRKDKDDVTFIGVNSGNAGAVNYIEVLEPVKTVLAKLDLED